MDATMDTAAKPAGAAPRSDLTGKVRSARKPFLILGAIAGAVLLGIGILLLSTWGQESTDDAQVEADVVPLAPRVGGQVIQVAVAENQSVKAGDLILRLDDADYLAKAKQAEAEVETATAQAAAADAQVTIVEASAKGGFSSAKAAVSGSSAAVANADAQIAAARASLLRAQAEQRKAKLDLARAKELFAAHAIPEERMDNAQVGFDAAVAAADQAAAGLQAAQEGKRAAVTRVAEAQGRFEASAPIQPQIQAAHAQADLAHARAKAAQAALDIARLQLSYTRLVAPADGMVSKLGAHEGQLVQPGQPVAELVPLQTYVLANFKETQTGKMRPGQHAKISIDAYGGREFQGEVESLSGGTGARFSLLPADNASGNFVKVVQRVPVRIRWTQVPKDVVLRAGLSADVTVQVR